MSIVEPRQLRRILGVPDRLTVVAYLCVGYVRAFAAEPDLQRAGWEGGVPVESVVHRERYIE